MNIDLSNSYLIGDQNHDVQAGINGGLQQNYVVPTGLYPRNESKLFEADPKLKDNMIICANLSEAVDKILNRELRRQRVNEQIEDLLLKQKANSIVLILGFIALLVWDCLT